MLQKMLQGLLPMSKQLKINELAKNYITQAGEKKKLTLEEILGFVNAERRMYDMVFGDGQRAYLRVLVDACKKKRCKEIIQPFVIRDIDKLLSIEDDKARKTACILVGICAPDECADNLWHALREEKTRFVRPSIILALGNTATPDHFLDGYIVEPGEPKHVREEEDALKKALANTVQPQKAEHITLPDWSTLTSIKLSALRAELVEKQCQFNNQSKLFGAVDVRTKDIANLRCYEEALYYIGEIGEYKQAAEKLSAFGCKGLYYRIEAGCYGNDQRRDMIRTISEGFARFGYTDNPSAYAFEIRLVKNGTMYAVFSGDNRFSYREQSIPASINPVTAASIMRICKPYMKDDASVLDPFCGSATMLIERAYIKRTSALVGVDISPKAIKVACANRKASKTRIALIKSDILEYGAVQYDEIISNMPFGIRVSGHESNLKLYKAFSEKMSSLLKDDGIAFLYTQEKKLLREVVEEIQDFTIVREEKFDSGGLCPTLFIIKRSLI